MADNTEERENSLVIINKLTKPMELQEIKIADDDTERNKTGSVESLKMFTNKGYDNDPEQKSDQSEDTDTLNVISPGYDNAPRLSSGNILIGVDGSAKKDEREFYLYRAREGEEEAQMVAGEKVNNLEIKFVTLPGLVSNVADKHQLDRLTKQFWRPVLKKREGINKFINNLVLAGDVELMQRAFIQFPNLENVILNPFNKDKKKQEDLDSLLHVCARHGTGNTMQKLLRAKSPNIPLDLRSNMTETNDSILHAAVHAQNFDTTKQILEYFPEQVEFRRLTVPVIGIKKHFTWSSVNRSSKEERSCNRGSELIDLTNERKDTALHISMNKQDYSLVELLLDCGADISVQDRYGNNVLHIAAINNDITAMEMIVASQKETGESGVAELKDVMLAKNKKGKKPTELATKKETMEVFLNCYTDETEKNEQLGMLLATATERNNLDLATFLVSKGASLDFESDQGVTALKLASKRGYTDLVGYILQEGSDPNYKSEKSAYTAINNATKSGHKELVKLLINHNASLWDDQIMETSALHSAVNGGQIHLVNFLVKEYGMDPNTTDCNGHTPLYYAVRQGHKDCVKALLNCRADPEQPVDKFGNKAIHQAAMNNDRNILKLLLEFGARPDDKETSGKTPMDIALRNDYPHILELLLEFQVTLDRQDEENNNPMHVIAYHGSYKCANFLLRVRQGQVEVAFQQLKQENVDGETPISIAKRKGDESVLTTFIERVPMEYFDENAMIYHEFMEEEQFDILKTIFNRMCLETNGGAEVHCRALMLDVNGRGESPFSRKFSHLLPSLLHKLVDCNHKELREHPLVNKTVEKKLNFYRIWYILTFLVYVVFLIFLTIALFLASYECDHDLKSFISLNQGTNLRLTAETFSWVYVCLLTVSEFIEFAYGWSRLLKVKRFTLKMRNFQILKTDELDGVTSEKLKDQTNCFIFTLELAKRARNLVPYLNNLMFYLPQAILQYIHDSPTDLLGIISFYLYFGIRYHSANIAWIFASLSFIGFIISMLKYTRVIPSLGAYIDTVKAVFSKDIPRFMVLYLIVVAAYMGGIHLAARVQPLGSQQRTRLTIDGKQNSDLCLNDTSQLFFFNQDTTDTYTFLTPFVDGMILLLDGGPGNRQDDIMGVNLYFAVIYILFAFTIIVVLSNILIAQLSETYAELNAQGTFYYRMGLVVSMELESTLAFFLGKYFRQLTSIKSFNVPIDEWKDLVHRSPGEDINKQLSDLHNKMDKSSTALYEGIEKIISHEERLDNVSEKVNEVLSKVSGPVDPKHGIGQKKFSSIGPLFEDRIGKVESTVERVVMQNLHLEEKLDEVLILLKNR